MLDYGGPAGFNTGNGGHRGIDVPKTTIKLLEFMTVSLN